MPEIDLEALRARLDSDPAGVRAAAQELVAGGRQNDPELHNLLAEACLRLGDMAAAVAAMRAASARAPGRGDLQKKLGDALIHAGDFIGAHDVYRQLLVREPGHADVLNNLGVALLRLRRYAEAEKIFRQQLAADPGAVGAANNLASILFETGHNEEAIRWAESALKSDPGHVAAHNNRGNALAALGRYTAASGAYAAALERAPRNFEILSKLMLCRARICDWEGLAPEMERAAGFLGARVPPMSAPNPWAWLGIFDQPALHRQAAEIAAQVYRPRPELGPPALPKAEAKLKIGYFSADFHDHPTNHLIWPLFGLHDRSYFEVHVFSFGPLRDSAFRNRAARGADQFHDVRAMSDINIAQMARQIGLSVAVDLNGLTANKRTGIFTFRAAPVQAAYLGYPGTLCVPSIDYAIADETVITAENRPYMSEAVAFLPDSYQFNHRRNAVADPGPSRADCGLPDGAVVYCCFNSVFKISRPVFDRWMQIMSAVPNSVLWLFTEDAEARERLRRAAEQRGVVPSRLVFAERLSNPDHLARYRHADLFLDTLPYNAHTTASDALRMGVPVITQPGVSFAARVGASLLNAVRMPELIVPDAHAYVALAIALGRDAERRAALRERLAAGLDQAPLFNPRATAAALEDLYVQMLDRCRAGLSPADLHAHQR